MMGPLADVAQLARASACHAEGRGFESLHPLDERPALRALLFLPSLDPRASPGQDPEQSCDRNNDENDPHDHHLELISFRELNGLNGFWVKNRIPSPARGG